MASTSEVTIGAKVANAEKLLTHLKSFVGFNPPTPELSGTELNTRIDKIKSQNIDAAGTAQTYSAAVDTRQKLFQKDSDSLIKILPSLGATVRSAFGKTSKEAADVASLITKIRGVKTKKPDKDATAEFVSQSERSFGSMTQNYSDLIVRLEKYGANYNPSNATIKLAALKDKLTKLTDANNKVTASYGAFKGARDTRLVLYKDLTAITQRIKDAVKSQYGLKSTEYALVKGLKV